MSDDQNNLLRLPTPSHSRYTNLLSDIEKGEIKIPQFQRDFVWSVQKTSQSWTTISTNGKSALGRRQTTWRNSNP